MNDASTAPGTAPVWQTHLGDGVDDGTVYAGHFNPALLESFAHAPRTLLDIGCSSGLLGAEVKRRHPACRTIGVEPHRSTANAAAKRLDQIVQARFEDVDFAAQGISPGSIDTVVAADVLEHMVDPWRAMLKLKPLLTPDAQIIISLPNGRHLRFLHGLLDQGEWRYAERGILDITHLRFFSLKTFGELLAQTGYRAEHCNYFLDQSLEDFYQKNIQKPNISFGIGRLVMNNVTPQELTELCTWQFFIRARPLP
ncbi:MAG TPA: class I SAM-dependent methyltransferase [Usitatibacteraceae bacterium]|nr:class I SAM-dependent methyltransferase [Usitatibacteraceae bacterium]